MFEFFFQVFGVSSFVIPLFFFAHCIRKLSDNNATVKDYNFSALFILIPFICIFITYAFEKVALFPAIESSAVEYKMNARYYNGGYLGFYLLHLLGSTFQFHVVGLASFLLSTIILFIAFSIRIRFLTILKYLLSLCVKEKEDFSPKKNEQSKKVAFSNMKIEFSQKQKDKINFNKIPPLAILEDNSYRNSDDEDRSDDLMNVLQDFGIHGKIVSKAKGPLVTLYEFEPSAGTKASRVIGLAEDIARSMKCESARISIISENNALGIELPNKIRDLVSLRALLAHYSYTHTEAKIPLILGQTISGSPHVADLAAMPHLLMAGTTGSGKSVAVNNMILSILYKYTPEECKFIMIDPKMLELSVYRDIPHLAMPVVTDPRAAVEALRWAVNEMERRYRMMSILSVRNIAAYNSMIDCTDSDEIVKHMQVGFDEESKNPIFEKVSFKKEKIPYIVIIVDEMADLMLVAGKDVEECIQRLAQMARASGMHIIMATQRPSVDVVTGIIKANFPTRISFQVASKIDSRTIIGENGAEQLLGKGDMLYVIPGKKASRIHAPFVSDKDVEKVADFLRSIGRPSYYTKEETHDINSNTKIENITSQNNYFQNYSTFSRNFNESTQNEDEKLYHEAVRMVIRENRVSISYVQRFFRIGYNKAASIVERMEKEGIVTPPNHSGKREVIGKN
uniref:DNA translocase FtsK n=1 Tax=Candidatus Fokinia crypta TaxID=1920990 RepID=UPI002B260F09|nr:DNA translocase FtsK [Candidatus Fokinia cryptica]